MCLSGYMCPNIDAEPSSGGGGPEPGFSQLVVPSGVEVRLRKRTSLPSKQGGWLNFLADGREPWAESQGPGARR